jgi:hypothetical protein
LQGDIDRKVFKEAHSDGMGSPDYFKEESKTRNYILNILSSRSSCGVSSSPTAVVTADSAQEPTVTPIPTLSTEEEQAAQFMELLVEYDQDSLEFDLTSRLEAVLAECARDCGEISLQPLVLASAAETYNLKSKLTMLQPTNPSDQFDEAEVTIRNSRGQTVVLDSRSEDVAAIEGVRAITRNDGIYVFSRPSEEVKVTPKNVGSEPIVPKVLEDGKLTTFPSIRPGETFDIELPRLPQLDPDVRFDRNGDGVPDRLDPIRTEDVPRIPRP